LTTTGSLSASAVERLAIAIQETGRGKRGKMIPIGARIDIKRQFA
jgi:hypothetical protein